MCALRYISPDTSSASKLTVTVCNESESEEAFIKLDARLPHLRSNQSHIIDSRTSVPYSKLRQIEELQPNSMGSLKSFKDLACEPSPFVTLDG